MFLFIVYEDFEEHIEDYHLNTSHVLIYLNGIGIKAIKPENLNTSHVLIYRNCKMSGVWQNKFKYISCSYLSLAVVLRTATG